jgi:glutaredoxin
MRKRRLRERTFKRVSFATTLAGVVLMAIGLQQGLLSGRWILAAALFVAGVALALSSTLLEIEPEPGFTITLYTREGCALCDAARSFLASKQREYDYDVWEVDVDHDAEALARYSDWVPVAVADGEELFRAAPDYVRLEQRLRRMADARVRR